MRHKPSREEKERLLSSKETELQIRWGNPLPDPFDMTRWKEIKELSDEQLDRSLASTIGQIQFEKRRTAVKWIIAIPLLLFAVLGILGLLLFGIKQLVNFLR